MKLFKENKVKKKLDKISSKVPKSTFFKYSFKTMSLLVGVASVAAAIIINFDKFFPAI